MFDNVIPFGKLKSRSFLFHFLSKMYSFLHLVGFLRKCYYLVFIYDGFSFTLCMLKKKYLKEIENFIFLLKVDSNGK